MLDPVELEFRIKDGDLEEGSKRVVKQITDMDDESANLIKRLEELSAKLNQMRSQLAELDLSAISNMQAEINEIVEKFKGIASPEVYEHARMVAEGFTEVKEAAEITSEAVGGLNQKLLEDVSNGASELSKGFVSVEESAKKISDAVNDLGKELNKDATEGTAKLKDSLDNIEKKSKQAASGLGELEDKLGQVKKKKDDISSPDVSDSIEDLADGFDDVAEAAEGAAGMTGQLSQLITGGIYSMAIAVIGALAAAIYKLATEESSLEKAIKRVNETYIEHLKNMNLEMAVIDDMFDRLRNATEGTKGFETAKNAILDQYGDYLMGLDDEVSSLKDVEGAYKAVSDAALQSARARALTKGTASAVDEYNEVFGKNFGMIRSNFQKAFADNYSVLLDDLNASLLAGSEFSTEVKKAIDSFTMRNRESDGIVGIETSNHITHLIDGIVKARKTMMEERGRLQDIFKDFADPAPVVNNYDLLSKKLTELTSRFHNMDKSLEGTNAWNELKNQISETRKELEKYSLEDEKNIKKTTGRTDVNARMFAQQQERVKQIAEIQRRIKEDETRGEQETRDAVVAVMEEGLEKELAEIAAHYNKRMSDISRYSADLIRKHQELERKVWEAENPDWSKKELTFTSKITTVSQLPETSQRQITERVALAGEQMTKATRDAMRKILAEYQSYEDKQRDLTKKYTDLRLALDKQYGKDKGDTYQETLKNIDAAEREEHEELLRNNIEATEAFRSMDKVIEQEGRAAIQERIRRLEEYLRVVAEKAGKESEIYKQAYEDVKQARRELDQDTIDSFRSVAEIMRTVSDNMTGAGSGLSKAAAEIAQSAIQVYQAFKSNGSTGEKVSSMVGLIANVTASLRDWSYEGLEIEDTIGDQEKLYHAIADHIDVANARLIRQKLLLDDLTGVDFVTGKFDLIDANVKRQEDALNKLNQLNVEYIDSTREVFKDNIFGSRVQNKGFGGFLVKFLTGGQAETYTETTLKSIDTSPLETIEDYRELLYLIQENGGMYNGKKVVEADIEALKLIIEEYDNAIIEQKQLMHELEQTFTDTTAAAISQSIADGFINGKRSMEDFAGDFETLMKNAIKASFRINVTDMLAKDFYQKFVEATQSDFVLTADEIAALKDDFQKRIEAAGEQWKLFEEIFNQAGIDLSDTEKEQKKEVGGFQTMSQETGDFLLGQFTAFRIHVKDIYDLINDMSLDRGSIVSLLTAIEGNTADTVLQLITINEHLRRAETEGVKML